MKNNDYPIYFRSKGNDIYASYDGVRWFLVWKYGMLLVRNSNFKWKGWLIYYGKI